MSIELIEKQQGHIVEVKATGKLTAADYERFVPQLESAIKQHGKIRVLFEMHDFHGWTASALWEDIKFDVRHFRDIERLALVGETKWEKQMAAFCKPFTSAEIRYFDHAQADDAKSWLESD